MFLCFFSIAIILEYNSNNSVVFSNVSVNLRLVYGIILPRVLSLFILFEAKT